MLRLTAAFLLLGAEGRRADEEFSITVEVDGDDRELTALYSEDPLAVAQGFCNEHGATENVEGLECATTLAEELILMGSRLGHLPVVPTLRLRPAVGVKDFCREYGLAEAACEALRRDVTVDVPSRALGYSGELHLRVDLSDEASPRVEAAVEVLEVEGVDDAPFAVLRLEEALDVVVLPSRPKCAFDAFGRAAAAACVVHGCGIEVAEQIAASKRIDDCREQRLVVSVSTLPGRIKNFASRQLAYIEAQTRPADAIYLAVPEHSARQRREYVIPAALQLAVDAGRLHLLRTKVDWGPATKLIPVLLVETRPSTIIVTLDDDINYPTTLLNELFKGVERHPEAALGFRGYRLPPNKEDEEEDYVRHANFVYFDSSHASEDVRVDVLGGLAGVAYRSGFFDTRRLTDYANWPGGAFYVDDDWISTALDEAGVARIVLRSSEVALELRDSPIVAPHHEIGALNAPSHAFRNIAFQAQLLSTARRRGLYEQVYHTCEIASALTDEAEFGLVLEAVDARRCGNVSAAFVVAESNVQWETTVAYDRLVAHHAPLDGLLLGASHEALLAAELGASLSKRAKVRHASSVQFLSEVVVVPDVLHLNSPRPLLDIAAAFKSGLIAQNRTLVVVEVPSDDVTNETLLLVASFFEQVGCPLVTKGRRLSSWRC